MDTVKPKPPDRQLSPEKTAAILDGAMQEFLTRGYAAASMDRIAATAGVSKATVYSHFADKEGLFQSLIQQLVQKKFCAIYGTADDPRLQGDPSIVLRYLANHVLDTSMSDPQFLDFMRLIVGESGRFPELARAFVRNIDHSACQYTNQYFKSHADDLKLVDPEATARIFIGALVHYMIVQVMLHGADIMPMERDRIVDTLINLISPPNLTSYDSLKNTLP
jgi:TetR/AcrR family transcriptional regulator, regulator of autoinduction and epiphytic fitness